VLGQVAPRQQAAVDLGVQRLHAAVQHLGKAGDLGHFGDRQAGSASSLAVPPVESSLMPSACSACANSTMPVLSETEISAFVHLKQLSP
jgi:hypothetical protein